MCAEVASNASNLLMDIKPGYMLGAKPRQQAIGHVIGIIAGALAATPLFFLLFVLKDFDAGRGRRASPTTMVSDKFASRPRCSGRASRTWSRRSSAVRRPARLLTASIVVVDGDRGASRRS